MLDFVLRQTAYISSRVWNSYESSRALYLQERAWVCGALALGSAELACYEAFVSTYIGVSVVTGLSVSLSNVNNMAKLRI